MAHIFISTGEVSGDLQGSLLVKSLLKQAQVQGIDLKITALGGDRMAAAGAALIHNTSTIGSVGLIEALKFVLPTLKLQFRARQYLKQHPPDLVVLIDYIGGNLPMGQYIRQNFSIPMVYYIAPQEWVWAHSMYSTRQIIKMSDLLLAIFPEERDYYQQHGARVTWVGHPLLDRIAAAPNRDQARQALGINPDELAIALVPVSRRQELKSLLPPILDAAKGILGHYPQARFWLPISLERYRSPIAKAISDSGLPVTLTDEPLTALAAADLAIAKSGTVNLETALLNVPQVVVYRVHPLSVWLYQKFLNLDLDSVSPANLLAKRVIVPELLQEKVNAEAITNVALELLANPAARQEQLAGYSQMRQAMGEPGVVDRAAKEILDLLAEKTTAVDG
ncbi:lipid-A-disaccharide synthase [Candidatus Synechococcus calcipolaris G9]|uniref:Lipid-A-disaccharide synthase n=1 Tax=Candidatus Synechococcus calcipolaris G9 TaxID=1497997 RepID=A0ABT6F359_9SYNE|nr:lipid-A-disaccharide synthase [Candidatus Synechococcus calcipolaris]MDG2992212.1 lipid-A-disaccharide synthase [Candidatus Synechococcus calcipolaris G9]